MEKKLKAYRLRFPDATDAWLVVWCDFCHKYHFHGGGDAPGDGDGHRVAHCHNENSPYSESGYILVESGPATKEMRLDIGRRKPRGPALSSGAAR